MDANTESLPDQQQFIDQFGLPFAGYGNPVHFIDGNFGFSVVKIYPNGYASLVRIFIAEEDLRRGGPLFPLTITASYGKRTNGGITISSSQEQIAKLFDPIELISTNEFYYNSQTKIFTHKSRPLSPREFLQTIDDLHRKPTKLIRGIALRAKLIFFRVVLVKFFQVVSALFSAFLYLISGITIPRDIWERIVFPERLEERSSPSPEALDKKSMNFFGYKASAWSIVVYCGLHLALFLIFYHRGVSSPLMATILKNSFLTIAYVIVTLSFFDGPLPRLLKAIIKQTDNLFHWASYKRLRV